MFRTRDFALMLTAIVFLLVAIVTTAANPSWSTASIMTASVFNSVKGETEYKAIVLEDDFSREERIASLKKKISTRSIVAEVEPDPVPQSEPDLEQGATEGSGSGGEANQNDVQGEMRCVNYRVVAAPWSAGEIKVEEVEGARIVYREAATADPLSGLTAKEVLLQLPVRSVSVGGSHCLSSDIVGITVTGLPIRNTDAAAYAAMGPTVLIGYALDGFPIYGTGPIAADACGGATISGQYRYYLSGERDTVLNCFSEFPVSL